MAENKIDETRMDDDVVEQKIWKRNVAPLFLLWGKRRRKGPNRIAVAY